MTTIDPGFLWPSDPEYQPGPSALMSMDDFVLPEPEPDGPITLLLDMDGPLADFDRHFWEYLERVGIELDISSQADQMYRFLTDHMPRSERRRARAIVERAGWFGELPVTPGAKEGVAELLGAGVDVWVCTKPLEANPTCLNDKHAWLVRHFPELSNHLITAPDKSMIRGDILLDDAIKLTWLETATWAPVVFDAPFNRYHSEWRDIPRWSWGDPLDILLENA